MSWKRDSNRFANALVKAHGSLQAAHERKRAQTAPSTTGGVMYPNRIRVDRKREELALDRELAEVWGESDD